MKIDCCTASDPATVARWGCYSPPCGYCDDLGPGGVTQRRFASVYGTQLGQIPDPPICAAGEQWDWAEMKCVPGTVEDIPCPPPLVGSWPNCVDPTSPYDPPQLPGQVPTLPALCANEIKQARKEGAAEAHSELVKAAAITAAVGTLVGAGIGYLLRR